jgi:hypothetical protein
MEVNTMKKVFLFSRHSMTPMQLTALGTNVTIKQCYRTINSAFEVADEAADCDILAIVAPIYLQDQFLKVANGRPIIMDVSERHLYHTLMEASRMWKKWEQLDKIEAIA